MRLVTALYIVVTCIATLCSVAHADVNKTGQGWKYWCRGNCSDVSPSTQPGTVLMGGGDDVASAFKWMIEKAGGGNFLVLRSYGTPAYNDWVYGLAKLQSASTFLLTTREASSDPFVLNTIKHAEAIFLAGGDQANYWDYWHGTPIQDLLNAHMNVKQAPLGGTSAGMMVQGEYLYNALRDSIDSGDALYNPYDPDITLGTGFLQNPWLAGVITDTHFYQRDRMGRLVTFLARLAKNNSHLHPAAFKGISCDEGTAALVDGYTGKVSVVSDRTAQDGNWVHFLQLTEDPSVCEPNEYLQIYKVKTQRVKPGQSFDVKTWSSPHPVDVYTLSASDGYLDSQGNDGYIY